MLRTRLTEAFGLDFPLLSAPMALHSGGTLAAAVCEAGGLGSFGAIHPFKGGEWVREQIQLIRGRTERPFAVGYITSFIPMFTACFDVALEERAPIVIFSFGSPGQWIERAKAADATIMCRVQSIRHAREAVEAGVDFLIAQGNEAGGHTGSMNLLPLLSELLTEFPHLPVLAAEGLAEGRSLAAVLAAGADGACVGTAFLATPECIEIPAEYKRLLVQASGDQTVFTQVFDVLSGLPWPEEIGERILRNQMIDEWEGRERELRAARGQLASEYMAARERFDEKLDVAMGQGVGFVRSVRPAGEIVRSICEEAERLLRDQSSRLLS